MTIAYLNWTLHADCPKCKECIDLVVYDYDNKIATSIFNNRWEALKGYEVVCECCSHEFNLDMIVY